MGVRKDEKRGRQIWAISDNKAQYEAWEVPSNEPIYIHGRVVFTLPMKWKKC